MKKYRVLNWGLVGLGVVWTAVLMMVSPHTIPMHYNGLGAADSWGGRWGLWLEPLILAVLGLICDRVAAIARRRAGLSDLPTVLLNEWRYLSLMVVALIGFGLLQLMQMGWLQ